MEHRIRNVWIESEGHGKGDIRQEAKGGIEKWKEEARERQTMLCENMIEQIR